MMEQRKFYDLQDDMLHRCQDEFIRVIHSMGVDHDAEATEDEVGYESFRAAQV